MEDVSSHSRNQQATDSASFRVKPQERWGHTSVAAHSKMFIIGGYQGQYLGDIWEFDFAKCRYIEHSLEGEDSSLLSRSNHTSIFYEPHNAIYVFGGGQAHKLRFNDTLKLTLSKPVEGPVDRDSINNQYQLSRRTKVERMRLAEGSPMPSPRTYHASCLVDKFMVVSGGEANNTDMTDMWALNIEEGKWC